jgi:putative oxidoreductase
MSLGKLAVRVVVGGLFIGHGTQKLKGWFGGPGLSGTDRMMESLEMEPARVNSIAAGTTETLGGALVVAGLATPVAAAGLIGTMLTAIRKVHGKNGPWNSGGGWEYNAVLIATLAALADEGPGRLSLDAAMGTERKGVVWGAFALAAGAAGSALLVALGRRAARNGDTQEPSNDVGA